MPTTNALIKTYAQTLGQPRRLVDETARHLHEAGMLAKGDAPATAEGAMVLLLGLMAAPTPEDAPDCARLYAQIPLDHVMRSELMPDGRIESIRVPDDDPFLVDLAGLGDRFGHFLTSLIFGYSEASEMDTELGDILVGGGLGTATASVHMRPLADGVNIAGSVRFTLEPLGGGRNPDDAPRARLDVFACVPGTIWGVLREFFTDAQDGPRKLVQSSTEVANLLSESRS